MPDLEQLNIKITGAADKAVSALDKLIEKLHEIKASMSELSANGAIKISVSGVEQSTRKIDEAIKASKIKEVAKVNKELAESLEGVSAEAGNMQAAAEEISSASNALEAVSTEESVVSEVSHDTAEAIAEVGKEADAAKPSLKSLGDEAMRTEGRFSKLLGTVRRVATMRMIRWALRKLVEAVKEGLEILIEWDRANGNNTSHAAETVDALSAKWRELKKAVGAAFMPLIQIAQPILQGIMDAVIWLFNGIQQILRLVQGYSTYMKATLTYTKSTVSAAKELRRVLFGFDELNVLPSNGGGVGAQSISPIEFVETPSEVKKFWEDAISQLDFSGFDHPFKPLWDNIATDFKKAWQETKEGFHQIFDPLAEIVSSDFDKAFNESAEGWDEFVGHLEDAWEGLKQTWETFKTWVDEHIIQPFVDGFNTLQRWIYENAPWLAKILGIDASTIEKKINVRAESSLDDNTRKISKLDDHAQSGAIKANFKTETDISPMTDAMLEGVNASMQAALWVKFKTDTTLSPDTQKLIGLMSANGAVIGALGAVNIKRYATGGSPEMGTFFYAGEHGAEVVANTSGGTGVMNVKQMQDAVSNGNVQVVNAIGAMANRVVGAINSKDTNAYLDGQKITDTVIRRANGMARATGQPVIAR